MAVSFIQSSSSFSGTIIGPGSDTDSPWSENVTFSDATEVGDFLFLYIQTTSTIGIFCTSVTDNAGNTWTRLSPANPSFAWDVDETGGDQRQLWICSSSLAGATAITVAGYTDVIGSSPITWYVQIVGLNYRGQNGLQSFFNVELEAEASNATFWVLSNDFTTSTANGKAITISGSCDNYAHHGISAGTGWTQQFVNNDSVNELVMFVQDQQLGAAGEYGPDFSENNFGGSTTLIGGAYTLYLTVPQGTSFTEGQLFGF